MKLGFSLSPGGLLLPYHLGALSSLSQNGILTPSTPIAGSSAGAIAVASQACGISPLAGLEATIRLSEKCEELGGARGRLLPLLEAELDDMLPMDAHEIVNRREGLAGLAYRQIFPTQRNVLKTQFGSRDELIEDVCNSSVFPFFTTNLPFVVRTTSPDSKHSESEEDGEETSEKTQFALPRVLVDGYFTVPRDRFGCPIFPPEANVDREITLSVFPHESIGLTASQIQDQISPAKCAKDPTDQLQRLLKIATSPSSAETHKEMYRCGQEDALRWIEQHHEFFEENQYQEQASLSK